MLPLSGQEAKFQRIDPKRMEDIVAAMELLCEAASVPVNEPFKLVVEGYVALDGKFILNQVCISRDY